MTALQLIAWLARQPPNARVMLDLEGEFFELAPDTGYVEPSEAAGGCAPGPEGAVMLLGRVNSSPGAPFVAATDCQACGDRIGKSGMCECCILREAP